MEGYRYHNEDDGDSVQQSYDLSLDLGVENSNATQHEFMTQQRFESQQLLSPTQHHHQRHDSLHSNYSPLSDPKSGDPFSQQAELQPYVPTKQITPHFYTQCPAVSMVRSESQYSTSSGQQPRHTHRTSLSHDSRSSAANMSRSSSTHHPIGYHQKHRQAAPPPPHETQTHFHLPNYTPPESTLALFGINNTITPFLDPHTSTSNIPDHPIYTPLEWGNRDAAFMADIGSVNNAFGPPGRIDERNNKAFGSMALE
ncbi:hypothetical protein GQ44DRAFT_732955 [Phaeosphaeriaceae sp. PMI808]|nr:hypothetical protein GQ44DRAFT_732955 [Phaeosphaeriaceae sp. PMI808]